MCSVWWKHLSFQSTDTNAVSLYFTPLRLDYERGRLSVTTGLSYERGRPDVICPPLSFLGLYRGYSTAQRVGSIRINQEKMFEEGCDAEVAVTAWWDSENAHTVSLKSQIPTIEEWKKSEMIWNVTWQVWNITVSAWCFHLQCVWVL